MIRKEPHFIRKMAAHEILQFRSTSVQNELRIFRLFDQMNRRHSVFQVFYSRLN